MKELSIKDQTYSKELTQNVADGILEKLENGEIDELKLLLYVKAMQDMIDMLKKDKRYSKTLSAVVELGEDDKHHYGATFNVRSRRVYEYDDSKLNELQLKEKMAKDAVKNRKKLLESMKDPIIDSDTGELINPATLKTSGLHVSITYDK